MEDPGTDRRIRRFRAARLAWPILYLLVVGSLRLSASPVVVYSLIASAVAVTLYLVLWRCPQCHQLYGVKLELAEPRPFWGVVWPYFGKCLHCGERLRADVASPR